MKRKVYYDFHIHTALSPCGDDEMTPCNIVQMAKLIGLDVIAITDHNTVGNVDAVIQASKRLHGPVVLPGMELETSESIHVLLLFAKLTDAISCEQSVNFEKIKIANKTSIYGHQYYLNAYDEIVGEEENLLVVATRINLDRACKLAHNFGGVAVPAHVDKPSNAVIAILGDLTQEMGFYTVEATCNAPCNLLSSLQSQNYLVLHNSDAHFLKDINEKNKNFLEPENLSADGIIDSLRNRKNKILSGEKHEQKV